jgi:lysophospholipase L1-like esterase
MRVLVFGASITQGFWDTEGGWVQRLRHYYDEKVIEEIPENRNFLTFFNLGISGDRTKGIVKRIKAETEARIWPREPFTFLISTGINDSPILDGKNIYELSEFEADLKSILDTAREFSNKIMFIELTPCDEANTTPIPWGKYHYTNQRIQAFNDVTRKFCSYNNLPLIPIFDGFKKTMDSGEKLFADGLHPNDAGHQLIFELVRPELDKLLGGSNH